MADGLFGLSAGRSVWTNYWSLPDPLPPFLPVPNKPYGLCGREASWKKKRGSSCFRTWQERYRFRKTGAKLFKLFLFCGRLFDYIHTFMADLWKWCKFVEIISFLWKAVLYIQIVCIQKVCVASAPPPASIIKLIIVYFPLWMIVFYFICKLKIITFLRLKAQHTILTIR